VFSSDLISKEAISFKIFEFNEATIDHTKFYFNEH
jgi:hypothetical protein